MLGRNFPLVLVVRVLGNYFCCFNVSVRLSVCMCCCCVGTYKFLSSGFALLLVGCALLGCLLLLLLLLLLYSVCGWCFYVVDRFWLFVYSYPYMYILLPYDVPIVSESQCKAIAEILEKAQYVASWRENKLTTKSKPTVLVSSVIEASEESSSKIGFTGLIHWKNSIVSGVALAVFDLEAPLKRN